MNKDTYKRIIREPERFHITGVPTTSWWRLEQKKLAPKGFKIGPNAKGYLLEDILEWVEAKVRAA